MAPLEQECAEAVAFGLADEMIRVFPALIGEPPEFVVSFTLGIAAALVRAEAKAARTPSTPASTASSAAGPASSFAPSRTPQWYQRSCG